MRGEAGQGNSSNPAVGRFFSFGLTDRITGASYVPALLYDRKLFCYPFFYACRQVVDSLKFSGFSKGLSIEVDVDCALDMAFIDSVVKTIGGIILNLLASLRILLYLFLRAHTWL